MTRINLLKRKRVTVDEFKAWLNQLIINKKGALPDLQDWKSIKEMLDKVHTGSSKSDDEDSVGYSILKSPGVSVFETDISMYIPPTCLSFQKDLEYFQANLERALGLPKEYLQNKK